MDQVIDRVDRITMDDLLLAWETFPASSNEPALTYDIYKLEAILQEKEMAPFCSKESYRRAMELVGKFGPITKLMHKDQEEAMRSYREVECKIEEELPGQLYLFTKQWGLSISALYYYKKGILDRALAQTLEGIALCEYLIREGVHTLLFRTAELNRNLYRVLFKMGEWDKGVELAADVFTYLLTGESKGLYGSIFTDKKYWDLLPYMREGYTYEYFRGLVFFLIGMKETRNGEIKMFFHRVFANLEFEINTPDRLIIYNWIHTKKLYIDGDLSGFLQGFISFMQGESSYVYDALKISLIQDIKTLIRARHCTDGDKHVHYLNSHLEHKLHPSSFSNNRNLKF